MAKYTIDFEAWVTVEANDEQDAFALAQGIIQDIRFHTRTVNAGEPLNMVVRDDGVTKEEE